MRLRSLVAAWLAALGACEAAPAPVPAAAIACVGPDDAPVRAPRVSLHPERPESDDEPVVVVARGAGLIGCATLTGREQPLTLHMRRAAPIRGRVRVPPGHLGPVTVAVIRMQLVYLDRRLDRFQVQGFARDWSIAQKRWLPAIDALETTAALDGSFELDGCADPVLLGFTGPGLAMVQRWTSDAGTFVDVEMSPEARIDVQVADAAAYPVGGADVQVWTTMVTSAALPAGELCVWTRRTGPEGTAAFDGLPQGSYFVVVQAPETALHLSRVTVAPGANAAIAVRLDAGVVLQGRVLDGQRDGEAAGGGGGGGGGDGDGDGEGVAGVRLRASFVDPAVAAAEARTDAFGRYRMRVPRQRLVVRVADEPDAPDGAHDRASQHAIDLTGAAAPTAVLDLRMPRR